MESIERGTCFSACVDSKSNTVTGLFALMTIQFHTTLYIITKRLSMENMVDKSNRIINDKRRTGLPVCKARS